MPDPSSHIINSVTFEVALAREKDAFRVRSKLADFFQQRLQPVLDQVLSAYAFGGDYRIEQLVIDLGTIDIHHPDSGLMEKMRALITKALQGLEKSDLLTVAPEVRLRSDLVGFLLTGQLPWDARVDTLAALEKSIPALKPTAVTPLLEEIRPLLNQAPVRRRLLTQFSISFVRWLLAKLLPNLPTPFSAVAPPSLQGFDRTDQFELQLQSASRLPPGSSAQATLAAVQAQITARSSTTPAQAATQAHLEIQKLTAAAVDTPEALENALFVSQAGLVLLHPFLPRFFKRCGLVKTEERFADRPSQEKAVHLLYFLATGQDHPEEPHTTVSKVLCGLDIHDPIARDIDLDAADRKEAQALLQAAIAHWARLKRTSPNGLRSAFLQRQGKLTRTHRGWHLVVEQHAIDILLGTLPWNLSTIHLPWLHQPVQVEWV